jgi:hypothetical protein
VRGFSERENQHDLDEKDSTRFNRRGVLSYTLERDRKGACANLRALAGYRNRAAQCLHGESRHDAILSHVLFRFRRLVGLCEWRCLHADRCSGSNRRYVVQRSHWSRGVGHGGLLIFAGLRRRNGITGSNAASDERKWKNWSSRALSNNNSTMKPLLILTALFAPALHALAVPQTPAPITTCGLPGPDPTADQICVLLVNNWGYSIPAASAAVSGLQGLGAVSAMQAALIKAIQNQQAIDEQKEAADAQKEQADVNALQVAIQAAVAAALAKDATSLPSCPTGQPCSFTLSACDITGQLNADPINGPTQMYVGNCKAGYIQMRERLFYAPYVPLAGLYTLSAAVASVATAACPDPQVAKFHLEIAGRPVFPTDGSSIIVPRTATWSSYQTLTPGQVLLPGGVVKLAFVNDSTAPNCFDLLSLGFVMPIPPAGAHQIKQ